MTLVSDIPPAATGIHGATVAPRSNPRLKIVIIGLTITSSWGNGHATTYRGLVRELSGRGHDVLFLEHDKPWYATNRDLPFPPFGRTQLYESVEDLKHRFASDIREADLVIVGSYVPQGVEVGEWVTTLAQGATAFYDIDTPVTLAKLERGDFEYLCPSLIPRYQMYLSFTGGPTLNRLERQFGSPRARPLYCSVDPELYLPMDTQARWDLGYLGTYSQDRQSPLERLLLEPARQLPAMRFVVAGPQYPSHINWPANVERIAHLPPSRHPGFYNAQRFTLNITRADMILAGYSPSVRLFEAAACGVPIISDHWPGIESFFTPGEEIHIAASALTWCATCETSVIPDDVRSVRGLESVFSPITRPPTALPSWRGMRWNCWAEEHALGDSIGGFVMSSVRSVPIPAPAASDIEALGPWFHNIHLPDGRQTFPDHWLGDFPSFKWDQIAPSLPADLTGWTCLDIGCNAGFYSFELAKRGAQVVGIDVDAHYLQQAMWVRTQLQLEHRVRFERMQVYDLAQRDCNFDLVLFMGVFYHLRYPMLGLDIVAQKVKRLMVFQTLTMPGDEVFEETWDRGWNDRRLMKEAGWPKIAFLEHSFAGDPTNWWAPNHSAVEAMLRSAGLQITSRPGHEIYFCEPDPAKPSCVSTWNVNEILSATGRPW